MIEQLRDGIRAEVGLASKFESVEWANQQEDAKEHWDFKIGDARVDVKAAKRLSRTDASPNFQFIWVELKNVAGDPGWLYGKAEFIAFEFERYWVFVRREALAEFVEENVVREPSEFPLYKVKTRPGRKDEITLVRAEDIFYLATKIIKK